MKAEMSLAGDGRRGNACCRNNPARRSQINHGMRIVQGCNNTVKNLRDPRETQNRT